MNININIVFEARGGDVRTGLMVETLCLSFRKIITKAFVVDDVQGMDYNVRLEKTCFVGGKPQVIRKYIRYLDDKLSDHVYNRGDGIKLFITPATSRVAELTPRGKFTITPKKPITYDDPGSSHWGYESSHLAIQEQKEFVSKFTDIEEKRSRCIYIPADTRARCCLQNLGNTCYMNSALQMLMQCRELIETMLGYFNNNTHYFDSKPVSKAFVSLSLDFWVNNRDVTSPALVWRALGKFFPQFNDFTQQDSQEFLAILLGQLHDEMNRSVESLSNKRGANGNKHQVSACEEKLAGFPVLSKELRVQLNTALKGFDKVGSSVVSDLFRTVIRHAIVCDTCNSVSTTFEEVYSLILPIPEKQTSRPFVFFLESRMLMGTVHVPEQGCTLSFLTSEIMRDMGVYMRKQIVGLFMTFGVRHSKRVLEGLTKGWCETDPDGYYSEVPNRVLFPSDIISDASFVRSMVSEATVLFLYPIDGMLDTGEYGVGVFAFEDMDSHIQLSHETNNNTKLDGNGLYGSVGFGPSRAATLPPLHTGTPQSQRRKLSFPFVASFPTREFTTKKVGECVKLNALRYIKKVGENTKPLGKDNEVYRSTEFDVQECLYNIITRVEFELSGINTNELSYFVEEKITHHVRVARLTPYSSCSFVSPYSFNETMGIDACNLYESENDKERIDQVSSVNSSAKQQSCDSSNQHNFDDRKVMVSDELKTRNSNQGKSVQHKDVVIENSMRVTKGYNKLIHTETVTIIKMPPGFKIRGISEFSSYLRTTKTTDRKGFVSLVNLVEDSETQDDVTRNPNVLTLSDCANEYFKPTVLSGQNKYSCSMCRKHTDARILQTIAIPSKYIIVQLKRFRSVPNTRSMTCFSKNNSMVDYPVEGWNISDFVDPDLIHLESGLVYDLMGICVHNGSLHGGHYVAFIKIKSEEPDPKRVPRQSNHCGWLCFNDSSYYSISTLKTSGAYLLLYKLRGSADF